VKFEPHLMHHELSNPQPSRTPTHTDIYFLPRAHNLRAYDHSIDSVEPIGFKVSENRFIVIIFILIIVVIVIDLRIQNGSREKGGYQVEFERHLPYKEGKRAICWARAEDDRAGNGEGRAGRVMGREGQGRAG
jgi:hypothetical protein